MELNINDSKKVKEQYSKTEGLSTRISIHEKYSTNRMGLGNWYFTFYEIKEGARVLELGCGTGDMWKGQGKLISRCSRLILSDFSEGMLGQAKETLQDEAGIEYRVIDIQDIPYPDHSFDAVIANMMLYHVPDLARGLREVSRVLKKDGTFFCATFGEHGMMEYIGSLFSDRPVETGINAAFTLQNGAEKLSSFFADVRQDLYEDSLAVTNVEDMVDYIYSLSGMSDLRSLPRETVRSVLAAHMTEGVLRIPKEYGMFIARSPIE